MGQRDSLELPLIGSPLKVLAPLPVTKGAGRKVAEKGGERGAEEQPSLGA